jgi:hypothetical protein
MSTETYNQAPGIAHIFYAKCEDLPKNLMQRGLIGLPVAVLATCTEIKFFGEATLSWSGTQTNGRTQEKSTLKFSTNTALPLDVPLAFVVQFANGEKYLIGTQEKKHPAINYTETSGKLSGDAKLRSYEVTHLAVKSVLKCVM